MIGLDPSSKRKNKSCPRRPPMHSWRLKEALFVGLRLSMAMVAMNAFRSELKAEFACLELVVGVDPQADIGGLIFRPFFTLLLHFLFLLLFFLLPSTMVENCRGLHGLHGGQGYPLSTNCSYPRCTRGFTIILVAVPTSR